MRLITYSEGGGDAQLGLVRGDRVLPFSTLDQSLPNDLVAFIEGGERTLQVAIDAANASADGSIALDAVELLAPIPLPRRNVVCIGLNYADHVAESKSAVGPDLPKAPVFFTKPPQTVIGQGAPIPWHPHVSTKIDWEAELAVIIGRECRDIDEASALDVVFGYTVANDVTARDLQGRHGQWYKGKGLDGFCPLGPVVVTADEIADPQALDIALRLNGETKQSSNTRHMIFPVARLIAEWSAGMTLLAGDILLAGTPSGVGVGRTPPEYLQPGDVVEAEVEGIGVLRNVVGSG